MPMNMPRILVSATHSLLVRLQVAQRMPAASSALATRSFATNNDSVKDDSQAKTSKKNDSDSLASEWVKFQQSIKVDGFETGQNLAIKTSARRGKQNKTQQALEEALKERQRLTDVGGGLFPPLRYDEDETERLLREAYGAVPPRAGKRGTRNQKRQNYRWHLVRQIRSKQKKHLAAHQERKMERRHEKIQRVKAILREAPRLQEKDKNYQLVLAHAWLERMQLGESATESVPQE